MGGSVIRAGERFRLSDYFTARHCRLWVVLIPALLLTLAMDTVTAVTAPDALKSVFAQQWHSGTDPSTPYSASLDSRPCKIQINPHVGRQPARLASIAS